MAVSQKEVPLFEHTRRKTCGNIHSRPTKSASVSGYCEKIIKCNLPFSSVVRIVLFVVAALAPEMLCATTVTNIVAVGPQPCAVAINKKTNKIYVVNQGGSVSIIDGASDSIIASPVITGTTPLAIAVNDDTNKVYVANRDSSNVTVIDGEDNSTEPPVTVGAFPVALAVNTVTNKVYVANYGGNSVTVIDGATNSIITVKVGTGPWAVAVNDKTNKIYVANKLSNDVTVIDGETDIPEFPVGVGGSPVAIAVNTDTHKVYVANNGSGDNTITVIDTANNNSTTSVAVGAYPYAVALNQTTNKIYVADQGNGTGSSSVTVVDGVTNGTTAITVGMNPYAVAVNRSTNKVYVANRGSDNVSVIDGATNTLTTVSVADAPTSIAVNSETSKVYVANQSSDNVTVIQSFYSVSISKTGTGAGEISSLPIGIACGDACFTFPEGDTVVLSQIPGISSGFSGWGGACNGTGVCAFNMLTDKFVTADFTLSPLVKNQRSGVAYNQLQAACSAALEGDTISARSTLPAANLNLDSAIGLTIEGGYDSTYATCTGVTPVLGRVNIFLAPLRVQRLVIRPAS